MVQSALVRGAQNHAGSLAGLKRFLPTRERHQRSPGFRPRKPISAPVSKDGPLGRCSRRGAGGSKHMWSKEVGRKLYGDERRAEASDSARSVRLLVTARRITAVAVGRHHPADELGSTVVLEDTVVTERGGRMRVTSPVRTVSDGLRLIDTQLHTARRHLR